MEVLLTLPAEQKSEIMSTYDLLIEEGLIKGRQEGRQEGRREGARKKTIEMVCAAHNNGIALEVIAKIANLPLVEVQQIIQDSTID